MNDKFIFDAVREILKARGGSGLSTPEFNKLKAAIVASVEVVPAPAPAPLPPSGSRALTEADYAAAAAALSPLANVRLIKAVKTVESGGAWFTDIRADILDLDGPGGFIDGDMPKILFEAHHFSRLTGGKYNKSHPNISSPKWNRALYVGGAAEYRRLHQAMQLDRDAALKSASWGLFQIMGFNHVAAGFSTVSAFVDAMKQSEGAQLMAFVNFVKSEGMVGKLLLIMQGNGTPFAEAYNGPRQAENNYDDKLVKAYRTA